MRITQALVDDMVAHALADAPDECCGMVGVVAGEAQTVHRVTNGAHSPLRYVMDPQEQFQAQTAIEEAGQELGLIYHSHTRSAPEPSQTDVNMAFYPETDLLLYPDALYVIVGVADRDAPEVRTWRIAADRSVAEVALEVV